MQLYIGLSSDRGSIKRFSFDLLEMPVSPGLPKTKTLREMRTSRPQLQFSLRLHPDAAQVGATHADVVRTGEAAVALEAAVIVIATGPRFTPTTFNRQKLRELAESLRSDGRHIAWEPRGVWEADEAEGVASDSGMLLVRDLTREQAPKSPVIYTRLLPFGSGARVSQNSLEHLAEQLKSAETAYVVAQADGAKNTRNQLREWFEVGDD